MEGAGKVILDLIKETIKAIKAVRKWGLECKTRVYNLQQAIKSLMQFAGAVRNHRIRLRNEPVVDFAQLEMVLRVEKCISRTLLATGTHPSMVSREKYFCQGVDEVDDEAGFRASISRAVRNTKQLCGRTKWRISFLWSSADEIVNIVEGVQAELRLMEVQSRFVQQVLNIPPAGAPEQAQHRGEMQEHETEWEIGFEAVEVVDDQVDETDETEPDS